MKHIKPNKNQLKDKPYKFTKMDFKSLNISAKDLWNNCWAFDDYKGFYISLSFDGMYKCTLNWYDDISQHHFETIKDAREFIDNHRKHYNALNKTAWLEKHNLLQYR